MHTYTTTTITSVLESSINDNEELIVEASEATAVLTIRHKKNRKLERKIIVYKEELWLALGVEGAIESLKL